MRTFNGVPVESEVIKGRLMYDGAAVATALNFIYPYSAVYDWTNPEGGYISVDDCLVLLTRSSYKDPRGFRDWVKQEEPTAIGKLLNSVSHLIREN